MFEKVVSVLLKKALQPRYDSPRMMTSNLGMRTTWIFGISTSYAPENSAIRQDEWLRRQFKPAYDVDIPNIRIVRRPKFEAIVRRGSYPGCKAYIERLEVVPQLCGAYDTFTTNLP